MWTDKDREKYKADGRRYPSDLTDAEWDIIKPLFTGYFTFTADMREGHCHINFRQRLPLEYLILKWHIHEIL